MSPSEFVARLMVVSPVGDAGASDGAASEGAASDGASDGAATDGAATDGAVDAPELLVQAAMSATLARIRNRGRRIECIPWSP
jgi:hypothetical protein